jgi:type IV pilus assembly protein PilA
MKLDKKLQGFSLIELLVVVAIIGILAAVGTVGYSNYMNSTKARVTIANAESVQSGLKTLAAAASTGAGCDVWSEPGTPGKGCYDEVKKDITKNPYDDNVANPVIVDITNTTLTDNQEVTLAGSQCGNQTTGSLNFGQIGVQKVASPSTMVRVFYCIQNPKNTAQYTIKMLPEFDFGK